MDGTAKCWSIASRECRATLRHARARSVNSVDVDDDLRAIFMALGLAPGALDCRPAGRSEVEDSMGSSGIEIKR